MKKRQYEKPSTEVVMLQQQSTLLTGSIGSVSNPNPFEDGGDPDEYENEPEPQPADDEVIS